MTATPRSTESCAVGCAVEAGLGTGEHEVDARVHDGSRPAPTGADYGRRDRVALEKEMSIAKPRFGQPSLFPMRVPAHWDVCPMCW
jgi:hypothetical protein